ncbi:alpha/beta hydrolase [Parasphingopyxis algicola]|uniref:alpha/beta fold hydrolase n=1 Tax=Parasphingopyxis algicola TaxID=2026624 RepID=UPI0015A0ED21|nr:alpha/beta hydrolase [Parasphingopyxis algicola]QLC26404.1 alpha/beta hydrolase [Parasphingopyxis algicola]
MIESISPQAIAITFVVSVIAIWLSFRIGLWNTRDHTLWKRYGAGSDIVRIDGVDIRIKDEGDGPALILVHGAFGNLNFWDSWANELIAKGYRVVRFDGPPEGISGLDEKGHSHDRLAQLIPMLADKLKIEQFAVGGTSRGGPAAMICAAKHPGRVTGLILTQTPVYNYDLPKFPIKLRIAQFLTNTIFAGYRPRYYWRQYLGNIFDDKSALTPEIVCEYTDFSNRSGHREILAAIQAPGQSRDRERNREMAGSIKAPTLILATPNDNVLSLEHQRTLASWFPAESCKLVVLPNGGHFPPFEPHTQSARIVREFLDETRSDD